MEHTVASTPLDCVHASSIREHKQSRDGTKLNLRRVVLVGHGVPVEWRGRTKKQENVAASVASLKIGLRTHHLRPKKNETAMCFRGTLQM